MALYKFKDFYPDYREKFGDTEILNLDSYSVYASEENRVGSVDDALVDESGRFRYLVVDTGFWIFGKKVLLPLGLARFDYTNERVYVDGLTKDEVEALPDLEKEDYEAYEEQTRQAYTPLAQRRNNQTYLQTTPGYEADASASVNPGSRQPVANGDRDRARSYDYNSNPHFYGMSEAGNHNPLRLYEERLIANKRRDRVGAVQVGKHVETKDTEVTVPVEKERVVVSRRTPTETRAVNPGEANFQEGEVARMEVYEETADINKQAFVREEVEIRKEVEQDTVSAKEKVRREELDINTDGRPNVQRNR